MTYSTSFTPNVISNPYLSGNATDAVSTTTEQFQRLSVDDKLAVLWFAYTEIGKSITPAAPGAARLQLAEGLLEQFKSMTYEQQLQAMRDLALPINSPVSRAYGSFSVNTKLAFWYQLAELMTQGIVVPMPVDYKLAGVALQVLGTIQRLDMGQQITVLRNAVVGMGVDPLA